MKYNEELSKIKNEIKDNINRVKKNILDKVSTMDDYWDICMYVWISSFKSSYQYIMFIFYATHTPNTNIETLLIARTDQVCQEYY